MIQRKWPSRLLSLRVNRGRKSHSWRWKPTRLRIQDSLERHNSFRSEPSNRLSRLENMKQRPLTLPCLLFETPSLAMRRLRVSRRPMRWVARRVAIRITRLPLPCPIRVITGKRKPSWKSWGRNSRKIPSCSLIDCQHCVPTFRLTVETQRKLSKHLKRPCHTNWDRPLACIQRMLGVKLFLRLIKVGKPSLSSKKSSP